MPRHGVRIRGFSIFFFRRHRSHFVPASFVLYLLFSQKKMRTISKTTAETQNISDPLPTQCSMVTPLHHAADLNSQGVSFANSCELEEAYDCFILAFDIVAAAECIIPDPDARLNTTLDLHDWKAPEQQLIKKAEKKVFGDCAFFVFDEPLLFVPQQQADAEDTAFCQSVLLFNLALVCHRKSNCVDPWTVYKALNLYEM